MRINSFIYVYNTLQYTIMMLKTSMIYTSDKYVHDQKSTMIKRILYLYCKA